MFVTASHLHPDRILQSKARSPAVERSPVEGLGLTDCKYNTMVEVTDRDKHSTLHLYAIN